MLHAAANVNETDFLCTAALVAHKENSNGGMAFTSNMLRSRSARTFSAAYKVDRTCSSSKASLLHSGTSLRPLYSKSIQAASVSESKPAPEEMLKSQKHRLQSLLADHSQMQPGFECNAST
jgi:hypothetical protein